MSTHLWFTYALLAAFLWGFSYALSEKVIKELPISFLVFLEAAIAFVLCLLACIHLGTLKSGIQIVNENPNILMLAGLVALSGIIGMFLIYVAISYKNATLVNLIEISYPLFTLGFAWLLFKDIQINWTQAFGGLLVFSGIALIFLKSA